MALLPKTSKPAERALAGAGVTSLEDLARHGEAEIAALHGMGPKVIGLLKAALAEQNLKFKA